MTRSESGVAQILFDLVSTDRVVNAERIAALRAEDWEELRLLADRHRLAPILYWRLTHEHVGLSVPAAVLAVFAARRRQGTFRALALQRELLAARRILTAAGIPSIALKGAYLAFHVYPEPALRPLRDLDLLVPEGRVMDAFQVLSALGYTRLAGYPGDPAAWEVAHKHLPPLLAPCGDIHVELHARLDDPVPAGARGVAPDGIADGDGLWGRRITREVAGQTVEYLSETDLLLHLITHALYTHRLNNGPLVLCDIHCLLVAGRIEWGLFWELALAGGWTRGCRLLLRMTELFFGPLPVGASRAVPELSEIDALIPMCAPLMFREWTAVSDERLLGELQGRGAAQRVRVLLGKMFPSRAHLAMLYPVPADSAAVYLWYVPHAVHLVARRTPEVLRGRDRVAADARALAELDRWLLSE